MLAKVCLLTDLQHSDINKYTDKCSLPKQNLVPSYKKRSLPEVCFQRYQPNQTQASAANTGADGACLVQMLWTALLTDLREQEGVSVAWPNRGLV